MNSSAQLIARFASAARRTGSFTRPLIRPIRSAALLAIFLAAPFSSGQTASPPPDQERRVTAAMAPSAVDAQTNRSRFYGGVLLGAAHHQDVVSSNNDGSLTSISADKTAPAWSVFGGYSFNRNVAVEAGHQNLGESSFTAESRGGESWAPGRIGTDYKADGWFLDGLFALPVSSRWTVYMRLGMFRWKTRETFFEQNLGTSIDKDSGTDARYGVGFEYDVGKRDKWHLRGDVTHTKVDPTGDPINTAGVGFFRKF